MFKEIEEGKTKLLVPKNRKPAVFFNPRMKLNRDICCSVLKVLKNECKVFVDLLAGSGAKGIRIANEVGCKVYLNDANPHAYDLIKKNADLNSLNVSVSNLDANLFLKKKFDFIDIDPFGTPVPFLDNACMMSKYLGITATDTAPLCGVYPSACFRKYSAIPLRCEFCHEVGLRILLGYVARTCAKYGKGMECILSHSTEHYFRIYVRLKKGKAKQTLKQLGYVYYCRNCMNREFKKEFIPSPRKCACGKGFEISGILWLGRIKEQEFCHKVYEESKYLRDKRLDKILNLILNEIDEPFYYDVHKICKFMKRSAPPLEKIIGKILSQGFEVSKTHFSPTGIKTNATISDLKLLF
jgi:tRNA (guanine26-N2/guanine27-N2)-dimethyltransferase